MSYTTVYTTLKCVSCLSPGFRDLNLSRATALHFLSRAAFVPPRCPLRVDKSLVVVDVFVCLGLDSSRHVATASQSESHSLSSSGFSSTYMRSRVFVSEVHSKEVHSQLGGRWRGLFRFTVFPMLCTSEYRSSIAFGWPRERKFLALYLPHCTLTVCAVQVSA
jgi:hypothetical protein